MEKLGGDGENGELLAVQPTPDQLPCKYADLYDPKNLVAMYSELPEDIDEDSPEMDEFMRKPICDRPSCLMNMRIVLSYMLAPSKPDAIADVDWAAPPECTWRKQTDTPHRSES